MPKARSLPTTEPFSTPTIVPTQNNTCESVNGQIKSRTRFVGSYPARNPFTEKYFAAGFKVDAEVGVAAGGGF